MSSVNVNKNTNTKSNRKRHRQIFFSEIRRIQYCSDRDMYLQYRYHFSTRFYIPTLMKHFNGGDIMPMRALNFYNKYCMQINPVT